MEHITVAVVVEGVFKMLETNYIWIHPKTDWKIEYDLEGNYLGDFFEPDDYNRIKNNVNYLRDYVKYMFATEPEFVDLGEDVYYGSPNEMKASWWKNLQDNLEHINIASLNLVIGEKTNYSSNEAGRLLEELIRIETFCLKIYNIFSEIEMNKRRLSFRLGSMKGVNV